MTTKTQTTETTEQRVMIRFNATPEQIQELVTSWLEDEGVTIATGGSKFSVDLTYVKEQ